jgi:hypothetical protein
MKFVPQTVGEVAGYVHDYWTDHTHAVQPILNGSVYYPEMSGTKLHQV